MAWRRRRRPLVPRRSMRLRINGFGMIMVQLVMRAVVVTSDERETRKSRRRPGTFAHLAFGSVARFFDVYDR